MKTLANKVNSIIALTYKGACAKIVSVTKLTKGLKEKMIGNKKTNNTASTKQDKNKGKKTNGIIGLLLLLVVLSIAYSTYVVAYGTTGITPKVMLLPQVLFAASLLGYVFYKAFK